MLFLYYGSNSFLIQEKLQEIKERYLAKYPGGVNFWKFDLEEDIGDLASVLESQAMFAEKKLILLRGILVSPEEKWQNLRTILAKNNRLGQSDEVILIAYDFSGADPVRSRARDSVVSPKDRGAAISNWTKKRLEFLKTLGAVKEFKDFDKVGLINWCLKKCGTNNIGISRPDLAYLIDGLGCDVHHVWNEILKLAAHGRGVVSRADMDRLVSFKVVSNNFQLTDALANKSIAAALSALDDQLFKNEEPILILGALVWQFRTMLKLAGAKLASAEEAAQKLRLNPWVAKKSLAALKNFTLDELKNAYSQLAEADLAIKTGEQDGREALEDFIYGFLKV